MKYFLQDFGNIGRSLWNVFSDFFTFLGNLLNFPKRMKIIQEYAGEFSTGDWILMLVANILLLAIIVIALIFLVRLLRRLFRFRVPVKEHEELVKQVKDLQRDLLRSNYEKDKLIQMKMAELGMSQQDIEKQLADGEEPEEFVPSDNRNTLKSPCVDPEDSRFFRLTMVDNYYKTEYQPPVYDNTITLPEFCERFRKFAASELGLYYDISMMRSFLAAMGTARIIILQGISGTGKTSLAYAFGKFVGKDTSLVPVQPAWRERTELYGNGDLEGIKALERRLLAQNANHKDWECTEEMMKLTKGGKALYLHCLPADITGVSCEAGEVAASVFDRYRDPLYKQASFKPYIIAAMIFLAKVKDPAAKLLELEARGTLRHNG